MRTNTPRQQAVRRMSQAEKRHMMEQRIARAIECDQRYRAYVAHKNTSEYRAKYQAALAGGLTTWQQFAAEETAADQTAYAEIYGPDAAEYAAALTERADLRSDLRQF